jgi:hypothetical protein
MRVIGLIAGFMISVSALAQTAPLPTYRPVIYGSPYMATTVTTTYERLADGTQIEHRETRHQARNSAGYEWYEDEVQNHDPLNRNGKKYTAHVVWDPVKRMRINWCDCNRVTWWKQYGPPPSQSVPQPKGDTIFIGPYTDRLQFHVEHLAPQMLLGLETVVTRDTRTVKAGMDGNDKDLTTTITNWFSPHLGFNIATVTDDPIKGLSKFEVTELSLAEPDPAIFIAPKDFAYKEELPLPQ